MSCFESVVSTHTVQCAGTGQDPLLSLRPARPPPGGGWQTLLGEAARSLAV